MDRQLITGAGAGEDCVEQIGIEVMSSSLCKPLWHASLSWLPVQRQLHEAISVVLPSTSWAKALGFVEGIGQLCRQSLVGLAQV